MARVEFNEENLDKCVCPTCPIHNSSTCITCKVGVGDKAATILPSIELVEQDYCTDTKGKSSCDDLDINKKCLCDTCQVWKQNKLSMRHYCIQGSQIEREGRSKLGMR